MIVNHQRDLEPLGPTLLWIVIFSGQTCVNSLEHSECQLPWMSIFEEIGSAAWAIQALMLSAVTDL